MWALFIREKSKLEKKKIFDYKQEAITKLGSKQFKELAKKGLGIKVALL